jgi:ATP-dependent exoDNAse (exonuclease V) beta subunit
MRLENVTDDWRELDAGMFGDLIHQCLEAFGKSDVRDSQDAREIGGVLNTQLNEFVDQRFPGHQLPAVELQIQQIRLRFSRFAAIQAQRRAEGWQIVSTEEMLEHDFDVDGKPFRIRGKIDRIDQHQKTGQIAVWDYKSSDKGEGPHEAHYRPRKQEWKDLQLPLYRYLLQEVQAIRGADLSNSTTGFVLLSKRLEEIRFAATEWEEAMYESAAEVARDVIRNLRQAVFWPPHPRPPLYSEEFASICQDNVFEPSLIEVAP